MGGGGDEVSTSNEYSILGLRIHLSIVHEFQYVDFLFLGFISIATYFHYQKKIVQATDVGEGNTLIQFLSATFP